VVSADDLFDERRIVANAVGRDREIDTLLPAAGGGVLVGVHEGDDGGVSLLRYDPRGDAVETLAAIDLAVQMHAMAESEAGDQLLCVLRPCVDVLSFGGATFTDENARTICALRDGGGNASALQLHALGQRAFFDAAGT